MRPGRFERSGPPAVPLAGTPHGSLLLGDVLSKLDRRADRDAKRIAAILQQIGEQVIMQEICLHHQAEVFGDVESNTSAEAIEISPVLLLPGRDDGRG